jgi:hypothetical protein
LDQTENGFTLRIFFNYQSKDNAFSPYTRIFKRYKFLGEEHFKEDKDVTTIPSA